MTFRPKSATILGSDGYEWAEYTPNPALARWVSSYWMLRAGSGEHLVRTLPDACIDVTLRLGPEPAASIAGAQRRARRWAFRGPLHLVGARLLPGAAALLGAEAASLRDEWTPLERVVARAKVNALVRAASAAEDDAGRVAALEAFLAVPLLGAEVDARLAKAIQMVLASEGDVSVAELARRSGAHARTLNRLFLSALGFAPKRFARIVRLQRALRSLCEGEDGSRVAQALGYHDQAHFIHDAREVFGSSPRELVRLAPRTR